MTSIGTLVEPAYRYCPDYWRTLGDEVADLCTEVGYEPDPEQRLALDMLFGFDRHGQSVAFEFAVICSRQNLKTGILKQAALGWLFITEAPLIVWTAHRFRTAEGSHRELAALIEGSDFLSRRVKGIYYGSANKAIELTSGARLEFSARTTEAGRGPSPHKVVMDEAFAVRKVHQGALIPSMSATPDPQIAYGSSAGRFDSEVLRGIRDRGRAGLGRMGYLEWCAPTGGCELERCEHTYGTPGCALDLVENWERSNPLLGRRRANGTGLTVDYIAGERAAMPPEEFGRERLGWWDEPGAAQIFGAGKWEACVLPNPPATRIAAVGVAVSWDLSWSAIVAAGVAGRRVVVKPLQHGPGISWVVPRLAALQDQHHVVTVLDGRGPAAQLVPDLEKWQVRYLEASTPDVLDACAAFFGLVTDGDLAHGDYDELNAAVNGATTRNVGDRWAWGRRTSTADITPLEAATLAAWKAKTPQHDPPPLQLPQRIAEVSPGPNIYNQGF